MDQLTLTLVIVCSALAGVVIAVLWLRNERTTDEFDRLERTADRLKRRRTAPGAEPSRPPPPPTPDLVAIQEMWKASVDESAEDPDTAYSSPHARVNRELLAEPPTFPTSPGMKAFLEEEIASLPPRRKSRSQAGNGAPYPEAIGSADDFVRVTQGVVLRTDRGHNSDSED